MVLRRPKKNRQSVAVFLGFFFRRSGRTQSFRHWHRTKVKPEPITGGLHVRLDSTVAEGKAIPPRFHTENTEGTETERGTEDLHGEHGVHRAGGGHTGEGERTCTQKHRSSAGDSRGKSHSRSYLQFLIALFPVEILLLNSVSSVISV